MQFNYDRKIKLYELEELYNMTINYADDIEELYDKNELSIKRINENGEQIKMILEEFLIVKKKDNRLFYQILCDYNIATDTFIRKIK